MLVIWQLIYFVLKRFNFILGWWTDLEWWGLIRLSAKTSLAKEREGFVDRNTIAKHSNVLPQLHFLSRKLKSIRLYIGIWASWVVGYDLLIFFFRWDDFFSRVDLFFGLNPLELYLVVVLCFIKFRLILCLCFIVHCITFQSSNEKV